MSAENSRPAFTMLGAADAAACEGDSCLLPGAVADDAESQVDDSIDIEPTPEEAAAASARAVAAALDEGASL